MANLSNYGANALWNATAIPATLYCQGHTGNPGANGTANVAAESDRVSFALTDVANAASNTALLEWLNAAADETWTHLSIWDASTAGNCWFVGEWDDPIVIENGNTIQVAVGDLDFLAALWS